MALASRPAGRGQQRRLRGMCLGSRACIPPRRESSRPPVKGTSQLGSVAMAYVNLGATGLRVSRVCLGMMSFGNNSERPWVLGEDAAEPIVRAAADGGVIFFDRAKPVRH